jgi:uncharacterized glyoxalase superfamily protein PhnB
MSSAVTTKRTEAKFECIIPILNAKSVPASIDYYVKVLGFKKDWDGGDPPGFGSVSRDTCSNMLCQSGQRQAGTWIMIGVEDDEELYEEYKASGATIREVPTNYPWAYEMRVKDLDNHVLRFGWEPKSNESHSL